MYFYEINNFEFIKEIENAHQIDRDLNGQINGIIALSDDTFAFFDEDIKIKIKHI